MTVAAKSRARQSESPAKKQEPKLYIPVTFSTVSLGLKTCRIGITIDRNRSSLKLSKADEFFVDRRLIGYIAIVRDGESESQQNFLGDEIHRLEGAFDVTQFSVHAETYTTGLTMRKKSVKVRDLDRFVKQAGVLCIFSDGDIEKHDDDDDDQQTIPLDDHDHDEGE